MKIQPLADKVLVERVEARSSMVRLRKPWAKKWRRAAAMIRAATGFSGATVLADKLG